MMNKTTIDQLKLGDLRAPGGEQVSGLSDATGSIELQLAEATEFSGHGNKPAPGTSLIQESFSVLFDGPDSRFLAAGHVVFEHEGLGKFELFIVPVGRKPGMVPISGQCLTGWSSRSINLIQAAGRHSIWSWNPSSPTWRNPSRCKGACAAHFQHVQAHRLVRTAPPGKQFPQQESPDALPPEGRQQRHVHHAEFDITAADHESVRRLLIQ